MASLELANSLLQQKDEAQNILLALTSRYKPKEIAAAQKEAQRVMDSAGEVHVCL